MKIPMFIFIVLVPLTSFSANASSELTSISGRANEGCVKIVPCQPLPCAPAAPTPKGTIKTKGVSGETNIYINCSPNGFSSCTTCNGRANTATSNSKRCTESWWVVTVKAAKEIVPLLQTVLWLIFASVIIWIYHNQIKILLETIKKRVESGSGFKVGPVSMDADLRPQTTEQQAKKVEQEISEAIEPEKVTGPTVSTQASLPPERLRARSFQAEDLALRAIQAEYGVPIRRQLQAGSDMSFDGIFAKDGTSYIVEVKYSRGPFPKGRVLMPLSRILAGVTRYHWSNVKLILAVVYDDTVDPEKEQARLSDEVKELGVVVEVRCFSLKLLAEQFGIAE